MPNPKSCVKNDVDPFGSPFIFQAGVAASFSNTDSM